MPLKRGGRLFLCGFTLAGLVFLCSLVDFSQWKRQESYDKDATPATRTRRSEAKVEAEELEGVGSPQRVVVLVGPKYSGVERVAQDWQLWQKEPGNALQEAMWSWPALPSAEEVGFEGEDAQEMKKDELLRSVTLDLSRNPENSSASSIAREYRRVFLQPWSEGRQFMFGHDVFAEASEGQEGDEGGITVDGALRLLPNIDEHGGRLKAVVHYRWPRVLSLLDWWRDYQRQQKLILSKGSTLISFEDFILQIMSNTDITEWASILDPLGIAAKYAQKNIETFIVQTDGMQVLNDEQNNATWDLSHFDACNVLDVDCTDYHLMNTVSPKDVQNDDSLRNVQSPFADDLYLMDNHLRLINEVLTDLDASYCPLRLQKTVHVVQGKQVFGSCNPDQDMSKDSTVTGKSTQEEAMQRIQAIASDWKVSSQTNDAASTSDTSAIATQTNYEPFNKTNQNHQWCPHATCNNSPMCSPCHRRFLFLLSTGRAGSTSLERMLNSLPNVRISGENNNQMLAIKKMLDNILDVSNFHFGNDFGSWGHGYIQKSDLSCPAQHMMEALDPPYEQVQKNFGRDPDAAEKQGRMILGCKTIRFPFYWPSDEEAVDFITKYFPCARFVISLNSDIAKQSKSSWYANNKNATETLVDRNRRLVSLADTLGHERAKVMDVVKWGNNVTEINDMVRWLGHEDCRFEQVLHDHDKGSMVLDHDTKIDLGPSCRFGDV